ncbi:NAD(P)/FAD-dependent oxidoreductase [Spirosoma sp. KUDC1026]|uniref:NAD(P)/FAD-dependent oxidoreductase n=1 Tax=Spirosoma sp. KUDC1026 TaxID=2745947 RepID=UPI00159BD4C0|nr:NAD(P)/FAD-dependent oxidoreductase [Spirosoma sp. KUDC1026]QKZ14461.1 NAD(P)/FAD-dependent oxidoreductase [Spirosoma sp. KUDC1026]
MITSTDILIIGGGLAGLVSSLELARAGHTVTLVERKTYPFHKVCGEYISNEVRPYLETLGLSLNALGVALIDQFWLSAPSGRLLKSPLDLGGFGVSRYTLDQTLYELAQAAGVNFLLGRQVDNVAFDGHQFSVTLNDGQQLTSQVVLGAYGKRARLDKTLSRSFMDKPSPYVGVKYHIRPQSSDWDFPDNVIALHNFSDGYCGMSAIEDGKYCLCYLTTRDNLRQHGSIPAMEQAVLGQNPYLKTVFERADFLYDKPEVINEISFAPKRAVENHILMAGDSAGLITPLCGNGMAMAIHGARLVSQVTDAFLQGKVSRPELEQQYQQMWSRQFARRLWVGRTVQRLFGSRWLTDLVVQTLQHAQPAVKTIMKQTHGQVIPV